MNQKGFIKIPLLVIVIVSVAIVSVGTGVFLYGQNKVTSPAASILGAFEETGDAVIEEMPQELEVAGLEAEIARLEAEKAKSEAERLIAEQEIKRVMEEKQRQEAQRIAIEQHRQEEEQQQEAQGIAAEKQKQEDQNWIELEKSQAEEAAKIANIKAVDEDLSRIIAAVKPNIDSFYSEKNDTSGFIVTIRNTMNQYPASFLIQQSGQQLINESNNLLFILGKLIDIGNSIIREANSQV